ncbi:MAG: CBS domain-containing protein [Christensenellaceae bacterium]|jgi:hypothetical protein|nr:CBS domain-containing protein [Christensenellaceae bacterium]
MIGSSSNGARFINAYNDIDHDLRNQYNFKTNISFSDLIRRCSSLNQVVRRYEDDLIEFARLRNAIVHSSSDKLIAEPHDEVVATMEKIAKLVSMPPLLTSILRQRDVIVIDGTLKLRNLILETGRSGHSCIPVYKGANLIGVVRWQKFIENIAANILATNASLDKFLADTTIEEYLRAFPSSEHYVVVSVDITIEECLTLFNQNRKLSTIIVTRSGTATEKPVNIVTVADVMDLMKTLEIY